MSVNFPPLYRNPTEMAALFMYTPTTHVPLHWNIASPSGASFGLRVIQCGELLAFENITVRDATTVRVYPPTDISALLIPPGWSTWL
jgi:hypothetical protein